MPAQGNPPVPHSQSGMQRGEDAPPKTKHQKHEKRQEKGAQCPPYLCPAEVLVGQVVMHHALVLVLQDTAWGMEQGEALC